MVKKIIMGILCISAITFSHQADAAMSYEKALQYQSIHSYDIIKHNEKIKDMYGEKNICRYFSLLKKNGVMHTGGSGVGGKGKRTLINLVINYGFENIDKEPYAYIRWGVDLDGTPDNGYAPKNLFITFENGFVKTIPLQGYEYKYEKLAGFLSPVRCHLYHGRIKLNDVELYDIYSHGNIAAVSIDDGNDGDNINGIKHFFYSGTKDLEEKAMLTRGFAHTIKILEIDANTIEAKRIAYAKEAEKLRLEQLRIEVEREIKEEAEREALKKQILEEMKAKQKTN